VIHNAMLRPNVLPLCLALLVAGGCTSPRDSTTPAQEPPTSSSSVETDQLAYGSMQELGVQFVKLSLALGVHDGDYVDAYNGPDEWRDEANRTQVSLADIVREAQRMGSAVKAIPGQKGINGLRQRFLAKQFSSLAARARIVSGEKLSFDEETMALYDATAPTHDKPYFENILTELDRVLPGTGGITERVAAFREDFVIKPELLNVVFKAAIKECRRLTLEFIELPANESFVVEYVSDKPWSGYNWFQGNARSLIQVNTEFPILVDRAVDLACHEGYPGHHVYNTLLEQNLLKDRGWMEFAVFPLFSPTGLIAEGSANYGIDMAFSNEERMQFERTVVFPLAQLDTSRVEEFYALSALLERLKYAGNFSARRYLDGEINAATAAQELERYSLMLPEKAVQRVKFIDKYRSYVINYNLGRDIVAKWVEQGSTNEATRWERFERLLSQPMLPSELTQ